jgi:hypothetical protein
MSELLVFSSVKTKIHSPWSFVQCMSELSVWAEVPVMLYQYKMKPTSTKNGILLVIY